MQEPASAPAPHFSVSLLLFGLQVLVGLWLATNYFATIPQAVVDAFPFSTARAIHTNLLVLWLLLGFMGATYYHGLVVAAGVWMIIKHLLTLKPAPAAA